LVFALWLDFSELRFARADDAPAGCFFFRANQSLRLDEEKQERS
jgi:hypothetical protein